MGRKVRSDKKWSVQPFISTELRECIYRLSYITDVPVKDVIEAILEDGIHNKKVLDYLSTNFRRNIQINNTVYIGDPHRVSVNKRTAHGQSERVSTRVSALMHDLLKALAYSLDCSTARAGALLLDASVRNAEFVNKFVEDYLKENVDEQRMKELRKVLKYVRANNPYDEDVTWSALLSFLIDEVKVHAEKVQDTVTSFVINRWDK